MFLILVGAPGAGKGTQAVFLTRELNLPHISSGDLFREAVAKSTELGKLAKSYMDRGALVPDEVTIQMVLERLRQRDCLSGCLLDGFPRTVEQARALDEAMVRLDKKIDYAVYIKVAEDELIKRLSSRWLCRGCQAPYNAISAPPKTRGICDKCGGELFQRADDTEKVVRERLKVYFSQTMPILDYYRKQGKLLEVNGEGEIEGISKRILKSLKK